MLTLTRRTVLAGAGVVAAAPALAAKTTLDPIADLGLIHTKLHLRSDDGVVMWWMIGTKFGQIESAITPLFDMQVGSIHRIKHKPDGGYDLTSLEVVFYTDSKTGAWLRKWTNPYTGETVDVNHGPLGPDVITYRADGTRNQPQREVGGAIITGEKTVGPAVVSGGDVWVRSDSTAKVTQKDGSGRPFLVNDWAFYHGSVADVLNPAKTFIPATSHLQEITSWTKWMGMGDRTGNQTARAIGAKVKTYAELPEKWRGLMAQAHPEIHKDPIGALDRPAARLER